MESLSFPPALLLLADSALPLGSFAFSSGLESYLAHHPSPTTNGTKATHATQATQNQIPQFLTLSLHSITSSILPYLIAAYRNPNQLRTLDNDLDASTPCTVAKRASIAQGRALLGVWEKAFKNVPPIEAPLAQDQTLAMQEAAHSTLCAFSLALKAPLFPIGRPGPSGHLAPLFALVSLTQSLSLADTVWIFLFNHARAVLSAAVRAGVLGPYQSQALLAGAWLREVLGVCAKKALGNEVSVDEAAQCVPLMDVWGGRHEVLYTRIFNS